MNTEQLLKSIHVKFEKDAPMSRYTSFGVGGSADYLVFPADINEIKLLFGTVKSAGVPLLIMGKGTNLLVRDGGLRGVVVQLGTAFNYFRAEGTEILVGAGVLLSHLARKAADGGLSGLEFASGIPGTVGGGLIMNAGAFGGMVGDHVKESGFVNFDGVFRRIGHEEIVFGYRWSSLRENKGVITDCRLSLKEDSPGKIAERMREMTKIRRLRQPRLPSAGSVFRNHPSVPAGKLIETAGGKGLCVGGARVSEEHANFIVNVGGATAGDILDLIDMIRERVMKAHGIDLELEIQIVGED